MIPLDKMVGEKVMGWTWMEDDGYYRGDHGRHIYYGWSPSTEIEATWQVVDRMRELGYRLMLTDDLIGPGRSCMFVGNGAAYTAYAEDDCVAICGAALRAFGVNYKKYTT